MKPARLVTLLILIGTIVAANAHPGHDIGAHGAVHVLASPFHLSVLAGAGLFLASVAHWIRARQYKLAMRFAGSALVVAAFVLWTAQH